MFENATASKITILALTIRKLFFFVLLCGYNYLNFITVLQIDHHNFYLGRLAAHKKFYSFTAKMESFNRKMQDLCSLFSQMIIDPSTSVMDEERSPASRDETQALYESMGLTDDMISDQGVNVSVIHVNGVFNMKTKDIFEYMNEYQPLYVEWINKFCCNVAFRDAAGATNYLVGLTRPVQMGDKIANRFSKTDKFSDLSDMQKKKWRLGAPHPLAKSLILRFATKDDHKKVPDGKRSRYYKKRNSSNGKSNPRPTIKGGKRNLNEDTDVKSSTTSQKRSRKDTPQCRPKELISKPRFCYQSSYEATP